MPSYRPAKVASLVRSIISDAIAHKLNDPRISPLASVTRVEISADLQVAKVYVSVMGTQGQRRSSMNGLMHATAHVQRLVARQLNMRHCPEIRFLEDESIKESYRVVRLIEESVQQDRLRPATPTVEPSDPVLGSVAEKPDGANP